MRKLHLLSTLLVAGSLGCAVATPVYVDDAQPETAATAEGEEGKEGEEGAVEVAQVDEPKKKDQLVCYYVRPIGSNLPKKVCDTKKSRDERRERDMREVERLRLQRQSTAQ